MKKYIFFLDIDGTLLRLDSGIHQEVIDAAKAFRKGGGDIVLSTGRSPLSSRWVAEKLDITLPSILYGGASLYDFSKNKHIVTYPLKETVFDAIRLLMKIDEDISVQIFTSEKIYMLRCNELYRARGIKEEYAASVAADIKDVRGDVIKIVMTCEEPQVLQKIHDTIFTGSDYHFAFSGRRFAEVVAGNVSKAAMIKELLSKIDVPMERTFAAGDAMTDYQMMIDCAYTFAPVDSNPKILEICDETIPVCEEGGVAIALESALRIMKSD